MVSGAGAVTAGPYWYMSSVGIDIAEQLDLAGAEVAGVGMSTIMYAGIYLDHFVMICCGAVIATLTAGLYPAWSAGRVAPVESIRVV